MLKELYFKHDFNARNDAKLIKLKKELGYEGVGIYWCLVEIMYENSGFLLENDVENIAWNNHIESEKINKVLNIGFTLKDGKWSCKTLQDRIKEREEFCQKQKEKAAKRWNKKNVPIPSWYPEYEKQNLNKGLEEKEVNKQETLNLKELEEQAKTLFDN